MITVLYAFSTKIHVYENISSEFEGNILRNVFFALAIAIRTHVLFPACRFLKAKKRFLYLCQIMSMCVVDFRDKNRSFYDYLTK